MQRIIHYLQLFVKKTLLYAPSGHVAAENTDIDINNGDW